MQNIKVIIGASYGDEGKGLATDFFGAQAAGDHNTVNVLTNGGPQRGHTVDLTDGRRHVFKHFGAATFQGAATYYAEQFMINPMEFIREYDELITLHGAAESFMDPRCRFTTPWDMLVNQLDREKKGIQNSCGFGIWETVLRYRRGYGISFGAFVAMGREHRLNWLRRLRDVYFTKRLQELELAAGNEGQRIFWQRSGSGLQDFFFSDELLFHFEEDCEAMRYLCPARDPDYLRSYQTVLFENAQGLLLDGNAPEEQDFTTPSTTGVGRVLEAVEGLFRGADVEVCYVTRSYLTRHGEGSFAGEISDARRNVLLPGVRPDATNVENRFQGILRYGMMDVDFLAQRIRADFARCEGAAGNHYHPSVMVTHLNEYAGIDTGRLTQDFGTLYLSDGRTCRDVCREVYKEVCSQVSAVAV